MAKAMHYIDASGNEVATSYWRIVQINLGIADRSGRVVFYGYKDQAARLSGKQPLPGAVKEYSVSGDTFDAMMAAYLAGQSGNLMQACYKLAMDTKDVVVDPEDPEKNTSFFEGAEDLL